jgi:hypothetical protein
MVDCVGMYILILDNGRPFALEVLKAKKQPTPSILANIVRSINQCEGLNSQGDIAISVLSQVSRRRSILQE